MILLYCIKVQQTTLSQLVMQPACHISVCFKPLHRQPQVLADELRALFFVVRFERFEYRDVFFEAWVRVEVEKRFEENHLDECAREDVAHIARERAVAGGLGYYYMEVVVDLEVGLKVFFYENLALGVYLLLEHAYLQRRDAARGLAYRHYFESFAHLVGVYDFLLRRRGEARAPARHNLHEPLALKAAQRFAHRRAAHVHLFRNRDLRQALPARQRFFKNFPSKLFIDEFRGRVARSSRYRH